MTDGNEMSTRLADGEGLEIAQPEDFGIVRDENEEIQPVKQRIPGTEMAVLVRPLVGGEYERWKDVLEDDEADDDRVDELFQEHIVDGIGANGFDEVPDYIAPGLVQAIKNSSGHEVFRAVKEQRVSEQMMAMNALDGQGELVGDALETFMKAQANGDGSKNSDDNQT